MISRVIAFCARRPWLVIGATALAAIGSYTAQRSLARDAIPISPIRASASSPSGWGTRRRTSRVRSPAS